MHIHAMFALSLNLFLNVSRDTTVFLPSLVLRSTFGLAWVSQPNFLERMYFYFVKFIYQSMNFIWGNSVLHWQSVVFPWLSTERMLHAFLPQDILHAFCGRGVSMIPRLDLIKYTISRVAYLQWNANEGDSIRASLFLYYYYVMHRIGTHT